MADARTLNWRFVVPDEPAGLLLLPVDDELTSSGVTARRPDTGTFAAPPANSVPAVVVPDLPSWADRGGRRDSARLLGELCTAVQPGGWVCVGFANARYPGSPRRRGSLRLESVRRVLRRAGMSEPVVYTCLPDHRSPALLVPVQRSAELQFVLRHVFLTYLPGDATFPQLRRHVLALMQRAALAAPHEMRRAFLPAYCVVARRPQ
jgi:hypothetical protein